MLAPTPATGLQYRKLPTQFAFGTPGADTFPEINGSKGRSAWNLQQKSRKSAVRPLPGRSEAYPVL